MTLPPASLRLSIVVAAFNNLNMLGNCLASLKGQAETADTEVVAVSNFNDTTRQVEREFPSVRFLALANDTPVPELRTCGIQSSRGEIVALTEDLCVVDERWVSEIKKAHQSPNFVIGGAVENRCPDKLLNWAVYFFDYGTYMLPGQPGAIASLSGINVSYKREALAEIESVFQEGFREATVHEELKGRGRDLHLAPSAVVYLSKDYELRATLQSFYHLARLYADRRLAETPLRKRLLFALGSSVLPVLLPLRVVLRTLPKRRHRRELFLSLPHLFLLMTSWALGEFSGYLFGEGASAKEWR